MQVRTQREKGRESATGRKAAKAAQKAWHGTPQFPCMNRGGRRKGAGRKAAKRADGKRVYNPHTKRERFTWNRPVHVTVRVVAGLPSLRGAMLAPLVLKALEAGNGRDGFRLVHFSVQAQCFLLGEGLLRVECASLLDAPPAREKMGQRPVERPVQRLGQRAQDRAAAGGAVPGDVQRRLQAGLQRPPTAE